MVNRQDNVNQILNNTADPFVKERADQLLIFMNALTKIEASKKKTDINKINFCIVDDLVGLYKDVCFELNKLSDPNFDDDVYKNQDGTYTPVILECTIPHNPWVPIMKAGSNMGCPPPIPKAGNYKVYEMVNGELQEVAKVTELNENSIQNLYKLYYQNTVTKQEGLIDQIGQLFGELIGNQNLMDMINEFDKCKSKLEGAIQQNGLMNCPIAELIMFYKKVCRHIMKLRNEYDATKHIDAEGNYLMPGPKCNIPTDLPGRIDGDPRKDPTDDSNGKILFPFLNQEFFNGQPGGKYINGKYLQIMLTNHYFDVYNKIAEPVCNMFSTITNEVICEKNKLMPFDIDDLLCTDTTDCNCLITEDCDSCKSKRFIRIKKLFGTEQQISYLLNIVCAKIEEIHEFYKQDFALPSFVTQADTTYIQNTYKNPIQLDKKPNPNSVGFIATIVVIDPTSKYFIMEDKIKNASKKGLYDDLDTCKQELQEFLQKIEEFRNESSKNMGKKENKTEKIKTDLEAAFNRYKETANNDLSIDVNSCSVDVNLLVAYKRYLKCLTNLRCQMVDAISHIQMLTDCIEEEHEGFRDVLLCSEYYKTIIAAKWMVSEDNKHNKHNRLANGIRPE